MSKIIKSNEDNVDGLSVLYTGILQNHNQLVSASIATENKCAAILAGSIAIIALLLSEAKTIELITIFSIYFLIVAAVFALTASFPRTYSRPTIKLDSKREYLDMNSRELILHLLSDCEKSISVINDVIKDKVKLYMYSSTLFMFGTILGLLSLL